MTSSFAGLDALFSLVASPAGRDMESAPRHALLGLVLEALAAQPEDQLENASRYIQNALGLIHCLRDAEGADVNS